MSRSNYQRGAARERLVKKRLETMGWVVGRMAGSKGIGDLVALKRGKTPLLVEVKTTKAGPYATLGPKKRKEMRKTAAEAGATPMLIWWPADRKGPRWIDLNEVDT